MTNRFKNVELVLVAIFIGALTLRLLEISVADTVLIISALSLAFAYLAMGFIVAKGNNSPIQILDDGADLSSRDSKFYILSGLSLSISIVGILFYFLHWEGANNMLAMGAATGILLLILGFFSLRASQPQLYQFLSGRLLPLTIMAGVCYWQITGHL